MLHANYGYALPSMLDWLELPMAGFEGPEHSRISISSDSVNSLTRGLDFSLRTDLYNGSIDRFAFLGNP
jgi:hypothetical protein